MEKIIVNKNNQYLKLFIRLIKEMNNYNKNFTSKERYSQLLNGYRNIRKINKDSILYNLNIPNLLISCDVNMKVYRNINEMYLNLIYEKITKNIVQNIYKLNHINYENVITQNELNNIINQKFETILNSNLTFKERLVDYYIDIICKVLKNNFNIYQKIQEKDVEKFMNNIIITKL